MPPDLLLYLVPFSRNGTPAKVVQLVTSDDTVQLWATRIAIVNPTENETSLVR